MKEEVASVREGGAPQTPADAPTDLVKERVRRALWTTLSGFGGRGIGMALSLISVPLTINFLDKERYGLWITIGSLLSWLTIADLGLGAGLTNALATARAKGDDDAARAAVTTSFGVVSVVSLLMGSIFAACFAFVPWARVLGVSGNVPHHELYVTVAMCGIIFFLTFPLGLIDKIYAGYQEGFISNYWSIAANVVTVTGLVAVVRVSSGLPSLVLVLSGLPLVLRVASAIYLFFFRHPEIRPARSAFRRELVGKLLGTGTQFLVVQLAAIGMWQNDNIIIAQLYGAEAVGPYAVAFRIANVYVGLASMVLAPYWPAYTDAGARGEYEWIHSHVRRTFRLAFAATVAAAVGMVAIGGFVIRVWTRSAAFEPPRSLLLPIGVYMVLIVSCISFVLALNGLERIKGQMVYGLTAAGLNVVLSIVLGKKLGVAGVCWATCIAALIPAVLQPIELRRIMRSLIAERDARARAQEQEAA